MTKPLRKKFRKGTKVYVADVNLLKQSFSHWPENQVFTVSDDFISTNGKRYVWLDSYSTGLPPEAITIVTKKQRGAAK